MFSKRGWSSFLILIPLIYVFVSSLYPATDFDLGWHLKYGEYFFNNGVILRENVFSSALPQYKWVNISWGIDLVEYLIFSRFGFIGLSLLAASAITLAILLVIRTSHAGLWELLILLPFFVWVNKSLFQTSFRGHVLSTLYFSLLLYILNLFSSNPRLALYILPALFVVWANTNGSFILGLLLTGIWLGSSFFTKATHRRYLASGLLLAILFTPIHPFGLGIFKESLRHAHNSDLAKIAEWSSPLVNRNGSGPIAWQIALYLACLALIITRRHTFQLQIFILSLTLSVLSWAAMRYITPLTIISFPLLVYLLKSIRPPSHMLVSVLLVSIFTLLILMRIIQFSQQNNFYSMNWNLYCSVYNSCSPAGAEFIIAHSLNKPDLLTAYEFGGWLIWNYPQIKPYIDGRMHIWSQNDFSPFAYYYSVSESGEQDINDSQFNTVFISKDTHLYFELERRSKTGSWKKIFEDATTAIFVRKFVSHY
ncbi:MAG: hypothetical protein UX91_C0006G0068 [Candidatus Amesbacteria bacterium GW2011_GWB1_47_19]|nr:MAG: hypothetical protein UW51_C0002G0068 [Candidatus Amesbacteria bacterium GW2011_GWA1_44_24]KKU31341.1 MAG: hypothetical protein UX46_C0006G0133 [Candidatus Amesbacteria bacterium GW2011_GWC1_46_24]KKU67006.1 MAG: hypothetical protein UX91_C0006G0068 [Candidatus Amesbacteria bacterium GW2011_GWB1_47_19]OGD04832.1 MAG: hypothetical protein A2379_04680 [Candidatus Amesbacteria bacterium RIFOXYB1_FULL_47_13]HBC72774.1 hypothetical protein [Candidatus Amesbacteria bacterium]